MEIAAAFRGISFKVIAAAAVGRCLALGDKYYGVRRTREMTGDGSLPSSYTKDRRTVLLLRSSLEGMHSPFADPGLRDVSPQPATMGSKACPPPGPTMGLEWDPRGG